MKWRREGGEVAGEGREGRMATKSINKSGSRGISAPREKVEGEEDWRGASATFLSPRLDFFPQISIPSFVLFPSFETAIRATDAAAAQLTPD